MTLRAALLSLVLAAACAHAAAPTSELIAMPVMPTPAEHVRTPDQTFLTFPEWFLVHSPAEYAAYLGDKRPPSGFPLFRHIGQFWQGYAAVNKEIKKYPFNGGYHLMVVVIGGSTTLEYTVKGLYEATVGRVFEDFTFGKEPVPEEVFAARFAQAYVDFIRVDPWYKFDFWTQLKSLWRDHPLGGKNILRRLERRFALTCELLAKEGYARLIKMGTQSIYDAPKPVTAVTLSKAPVAVPGFPEVKLLGQDKGTGQVLATLPRYEAFTAYSRALAAQDIDFTSIAGNATEVLVSFLVDEGKVAPRGRLLFTQPVLTQPGRERLVVAVPVHELGAVLRASDAAGSGIVVEHVYDF